MLNCGTDADYFNDESAVLCSAYLDFSNHTAYEDYYFTDYTSNMEAYIEQWKKLDLKFEGICTGFWGQQNRFGSSVSLSSILETRIQWL